MTIALEDLKMEEIELWFDSLDGDERQEVIDYAKGMKPLIDMVLEKVNQ